LKIWDFVLHSQTLGSAETERDGKYRHHKVLRMQMAELDLSARKLSANQAHLQHQVRRLEKQMKALLNNHRGGNLDAGVGEMAARQLQSRVSALELASRTVGKSLFNMSRQLVGLDKLHQSMLQLLESVETLENKVDRTVPDLQREISKMEFNMAQLTSSVALLKEDQVGTALLVTLPWEQSNYVLTASFQIPFYSPLMHEV
jgi:chromosome segregation ATPase